MYGPCFSAIVRGHPLRPLTRRSLGGPLPHQLADGTQVPPRANYSFSHRLLNSKTTCGISNPFGLLSHTLGQVTNVLLTRSPLRAIANSPFDLHVLSTPPAFILSQDQTLRKNVTLTGVSYGFIKNDRVVVFPITFQLLRCRQPSGRYLTRYWLACQGLLETNLPMSFADIGSPNCPAIRPRLRRDVSFSCKRSVGI